VRFGQVPAVVFFFLECLLVGKELPCDFPLVLGSSLILENDEHAVVPTLVFAGMKARSVNRVLRHIAELFLAFRNRQLILLEDFKKLLVMSPFDFVDPLFEKRLVLRG